MERTCITITHLEDFLSARFLEPGTKCILKKEPNEYDEESITVYSLRGSKLGYVANSCAAVARGTHSAGYVSRDFENETVCAVRFRTDDFAIAELLDTEAVREAEEEEKKRTTAAVKASGNERVFLLSYLKSQGFEADDRFTEEEILKSPFPIVVDRKEKKILIAGGASMAAAAASHDMLYTFQRFVEMAAEHPEE